MAQYPIPTGLLLTIEVLEERVLTLLHRLITQRKAHLCIQTPTSLAHRLAVPMPMWTLNEMPNPTFPSLHPFPKKLFGQDNFYGRDMYTYEGGFPFYKKTDQFWK